MTFEIGWMAHRENVTGSIVTSPVMIASEGFSFEGRWSVYILSKGALPRIVPYAYVRKTAKDAAENG